MWQHLVLFLFVPTFAYAQSQCNCYEEKDLTALSAVISNAYNVTDFTPCYTSPCTFSVYAGDDSFVWSYLNIHWVKSANSGGSIQIYNGTSDTGTPFIQVPEGQDVRDGDPNNVIKSKSARIFVKYTQSGAVPNVYFGAIRAIPAE